MRVTTQMTTDNAIRYMTESYEKLTALNEKAYSGKMYGNPSDNPAAVSQALSLRSSLRTSKAYSEAAHAAQEWMSATDVAFSSMGSLAMRAQVLGNTALSDTLGSDERDAVSTELTELLKNAVEIANSSLGENYLFAGFHVTGKPFDQAGATITYNGDSGIMNRDLGNGLTVAINTPGETAFRPFFDAVIELNTAVQNDSSSDIQLALTHLASATDTISAARTASGSRQRQVQSSITQLERTQLELQKMLTEKQDTNMAEAISELTQQETTYKAVLEVGQRAISVLNLFDVLR